MTKTALDLRHLVSMFENLTKNLVFYILANILFKPDLKINLEIKSLVQNLFTFSLYIYDFQKINLLELNSLNNRIKHNRYINVFLVLIT